ncbi:MAG: DUF3794 domain-containing protein [Clostridiales bacterium]|nr:DUF3794 domain-containing protein [Clostridiales bacterium]
MDMRLVKENIQLEQPMGRGQSQAVVEGEITLPGGLREEARVLHAGGMVVVDNVEAMQDRVSVTGKVVFHTLYTQGDHTRVNAMEATADFTHMMDMPGAQPRNLCHAEGMVEHVDAAASGGRLSLRGVVRICASAVSQQPVEAVTGVSGAEGIQSRAREVQVKRTVASGEDETLLREEFALPQGLQIRETLYATARPQVQEISGGLGRCGVTGQVELEAVHATDLPGKPVVITRHSIPFDHVVELSSQEGETLHGEAVVKDVAVASQEQSEDERTLRAEVLLGLKGRADTREKITLLDDAYTTTGDDLRLTCREVHCRVEDHAQQTAESGKTMLILPEGSRPVRGVLCAFATPAVTSREQIGGRLTVEGMLETSLIYMTDDSEEPAAVFVEEPFRLTFAAQAGEEDFISLTCGDLDAVAITSDRVELRYVMHLQISGMQREPVRLVTEVLPVSSGPVDGSIVLYFTQPGERLWDIARRYRVPEKEIRELNPELAEEPKPGQGVVVWHRMA